MDIAKWTVLVLSAVSLSFFSCKKDNAEPTPTPDIPPKTNSFTFNGKNYPTEVVYYQNFIEADVEKLNLMIVSNYPLHEGAYAIQIFLHQKDMPASGTYTYHPSGIGFKTSEHFDFLAMVFDFSMQYANYQTVFSAVEYPSESYQYIATGSSITFSKNGDNYTLVYQLKFAKGGNTAVVTGQYTGKISRK